MVSILQYHVFGQQWTFMANAAGALLSFSVLVFSGRQGIRIVWRLILFFPSNSYSLHFIQVRPAALPDIQSISGKIKNSFPEMNSGLSVDLIKWPSISETTDPDLIHYPVCMIFVFASRTSPNRKRCPSSHTFLMLLGQFPLAPFKKFSCPSTFSAQ